MFKVLSKTTKEIISLDYGCLRFFRFLDSTKFFQKTLKNVAESVNKFGDDEEKLKLITKEKYLSL